MGHGCGPFPPILHFQVPPAMKVWTRFRSKREQLEGFWNFAPESQDHNMVLIVLYVPNSLDSGPLRTHHLPSHQSQIDGFQTSALP